MITINNIMHSSLIQIARNILFESTPKETRFSADYTDPDGLEFDMSRDEKDAIDYYYISFDDAYCAFCFIGPNDGTMVYIKNADVSSEEAKHSLIFKKLVTAYDAPADIIGDVLAKDKIHTNKKDHLGSDIGYAIDKQRLSFYNNATRIRTRSGRLWTDVYSKTLKQKVNAVAFWCKYGDVKKSDLEAIKKEFGLKNFFWSAIDSKFFIEYGDSVKELRGANIKEIRSKLVPLPTWKEIGEAKVQQHVAKHNLTARQKAILAEYPTYGIKTGDVDLDKDTMKHMEEIHAELDRLKNEKETGGKNSVAAWNAKRRQESYEQ